MSFERPLLLFTLVLVPAALAAYLLAHRRRMRHVVAFPNVDVLATVAATVRPWRRWVAVALFLGALSALCVALARPHAERMVTRDRATVVLVVDVSGSMLAADVKPNRLGAAKAAVRKFLDTVPNRVQVGLVAFSGQPQVATPPTTDRELVEQAVETLGSFGPGGGGTAIGDALATAVDVGKQAVGADVPDGGRQTIAYVVPGGEPVAESSSEARQLGPVSILFLSDGAQTRGTLSPMQGAARARQARIPVFTVALGTPEGVLERGFGGYQSSIPVPPDPTTMSAIAETTGGAFFEAQSAESLAAAYERLGSSLGQVPGRVEVTWAWLGAAAILLLAAGVVASFWGPRIP